MLRDDLNLPTDALGLVTWLLKRRQFEAALAVRTLHHREVPAEVVWPLLLAAAPTAPLVRPWARYADTAWTDAMTLVERWCVELLDEAPPPPQLQWKGHDLNVLSENRSRVTFTGSPLARALELGYPALIQAWAGLPSAEVHIGDRTVGLASWILHCRRLEWLAPLATTQVFADRATAWAALSPDAPATLVVPLLDQLGLLPTDGATFQAHRVSLEAWVRRQGSDGAWAKQMLAALQFAVEPQPNGPMPVGMAEVFHHALAEEAFSSEQTQALLTYPVAQVMPLRYTPSDGTWAGSTWSWPAALLYHDATHATQRAIVPTWAREHGTTMLQEGQWAQACDEVIWTSTVAGQPSPITGRGLWAWAHLSRWADPEIQRRGQATHLAPPKDPERTWPALMGTLRQMATWHRAGTALPVYWDIWASLTAATDTRLNAELQAHVAQGFRDQEPHERLTDLIPLLRLGLHPLRWSATDAILMDLAEVPLPTPELTVVRNSALQAVVQADGGRWGIAEKLPRNQEKERHRQNRRHRLLEQVLAWSERPGMPPLSDAQVKGLANLKDLPWAIQQTWPARFQAFQRTQVLAQRPASAPRSRPRA